MVRRKSTATQATSDTASRSLSQRAKFPALSILPLQCLKLSLDFSLGDLYAQFYESFFERFVLVILRSNLYRVHPVIEIDGIAINGLCPLLER